MSFLLAFLVLTLSMLPCADAFAYSEDCTTETTHKHQQEDKDGDDACSPFCTCTCCAGFFFSHKVSTPQPARPQATAYCTEGPSRLQDIAFSFWQPPRK